MKFSDLLSKLNGVKALGGADSYQARCPAHDDKSPSLSVSLEAGKILMHCHAGCSLEQVCSALGIEVKDLFENPGKGGGQPQPEKPLDPHRVLPAEYFNGSLDHFGGDAQTWQFPQGQTIERLYPYTDEDFNLLYWKVRRVNKEFQFWQDKKGKPVWNAKGCRRVLYRLPQVLAARSAGKVIFVTEGEKDCDNVVALGLCATTHDNGAAIKGYDLYVEVLAGAGHVVILADNDVPGLDHAHRLAAVLRNNKVADLRVVVLPGPGKDVSDWLSAGGTLADLKRIIKETGQWTPADSPTPDERELLALKQSFTDLRNAARLVEKNDNIRYCFGRKKWLVWTGRLWRWDEGALITEMAKAVSKDLLTESGGRASDFKKFAIASAQEPRIRATVALARSEPGIPVSMYELDRDPLVLNCSNGVVDLRTGELKPHDKANLLTKVTGVEYLPMRLSPRWDRFLTEVFGGDHDLIDWIQRAVGYSITGETREQVFFFCHGRGANGKSRFLGAIRNAMGSFTGGYVVCLPFSTFTNSNPNAIPADLAMLPGARIATASETVGRAAFNEERLKLISGEDPITARNLHESFFTFVSTAKLWLSANDKPRVTDDSPAFWRRVRLIPFLQTFNPGAEPDLDRKLAEEAPGILAWAVRGAQQWMERGLTGTPECVRVACEEYQEEEDPIANWLDDRCNLSPGSVIQSKTAYNDYLDWAEGYKMSAGKGGALTMTAFGRIMKARFENLKNMRGRFYVGLHLKGTEPTKAEKLTQMGFDGILDGKNEK
ncbi:MAG: phage/plasmid primase, P4 family [Patescibacteria group bacterium]